MKLLLHFAAGVAVLYAATRAVWHSDSGELGVELALLIAAVCASGGAVVAAIERSAPKPVSRDNGGARRNEE